MKAFHESLISLDKVRNKKVYQFQNVDQIELKRQLMSRGFVPGVSIKVLRSQGSGPLLVEIRHARMAIGRQEAAHIFVRLVEEV